jgi:hypothetical protein
VCTTKQAKPHPAIAVGQLPAPLRSAVTSLPSTTMQLVYPSTSERWWVAYLALATVYAFCVKKLHCTAMTFDYYSLG